MEQKIWLEKGERTAEVVEGEKGGWIWKIADRISALCFSTPQEAVEKAKEELEKP